MRTPRLLLQDILDAIDTIAKYLPAEFNDFMADEPVQSHVMRHIAIIGEASSRLPKAVRDANPQVPWRQIIAMRNIVVHVYHGINVARLHKTAIADVPALRPLIEAILAGLPPDNTTAVPAP